MRRLIAWLYRIAFGLQVKTHDQHIADLRLLLDELQQAAMDIDAEIEIVSDRLLSAHLQRDAAAKRCEAVDTSIVDRRFPNPAPRSY